MSLEDPARDPERSRNEERLFHAALDRPAGARSAWLARACDGDEPLHAAVEQLLRAHHGTADPWDEPRFTPPAGALSGAPGHLQRGEQVGRYQVVDRIGEGGMGAVYEALQDQPTRSVALKVLRADLSSPAHLRRFEYEAQVLARLHHPNVAQVYDAGTFERGGRSLPFFAMELIPEARSFEQYAGEERLSTRDRLRLFIQICAAVQHGHARGVLHRDLKPANVLVDGSGRPVVIDFGVARALEPDAGPGTTLTAAGHVVGTVAYMSPEQCAGDTGNPDIRCDVYSLGVLLFELLTGELPYPVAGKPPLEALQVVRDVPPAKLGTRNRRMRGDLETIVAKALEKEPERRYATAHELAVDLRRFLDGEPIAARPPSSFYQLRMFSRRHKVLVASVLVALALLSGAIAVTVPLYLRTQRALEVALVENEKGQEVKRFLVDMLMSADPGEQRGEELTVREMLDGAALEIERQLADRPEVRAAVEDAIGAAYSQLGLVGQAQLHLSRALELHRAHLTEDPVLLANTLSHAGFLAIQTGDFDRARELTAEGMALVEAQPGVPDQTHQLRARMLHVNGVLAARELRHAEAERDFRTAFELASALDPAPGGLLGMIAEALGNVFNQKGELEEAREWYEEAIRLIVEESGEDSAELATPYGNLATVLLELGELDEAQEVCERSLVLLEAAYGEDHEHVALCRTFLADILAAQGRLEEARELSAWGLEGLRATLGTGHPELCYVELRYGVLLRQLGSAAEADAQLQRAVELALASAGPDHAITRSVKRQVADLHIADGEFERAEALLLPAPESGHDAVEYARPLVLLYEGWHAADPAGGHDRELARWQAALEERQEAASAVESSAR